MLNKQKDRFHLEPDFFDGVVQVANDRLHGASVVVLTPEEFEGERHIPGTIARPTSMEGKVLYERH